MYETEQGVVLVIFLPPLHWFVLGVVPKSWITSLHTYTTICRAGMSHETLRSYITSHQSRPVFIRASADLLLKGEMKNVYRLQ